MYYEIKNKNKSLNYIILVKDILCICMDFNELKITYKNGVEIKVYIDTEDNWDRARKEYKIICDLINNNQIKGSK